MSSFSLVHSILLQPIFPAAALLASLKRPEETQRLLSQLARGVVQHSTLNLALKALLAAGISYRLNNYINRRALNNFVSDRSWDWPREIVVVTGGCSGIGEKVVRKLNERGIKVVILDIAPPKSALPTNTWFYKLDVTSSQDIKEVASKIRQDVGEPTVVINNAGIGSGKTILDESEEEMRRIFEVNVIAHFNMAKEFVPYMIKRNHGHIVTVASMASFATIAGNASYSATKVGVLAFHEGLASELKSRYGASKVRTT